MMQNFNSQPAFYFPTSTLMLDDDVDFLQSISYRLRSGYKIITTSSFEEALEIIEEKFEAQYNNYSSRFISNLTEHNNEDETDILLGIDFDKMKKVFINPIKESLISTLIIDYSMPKMSGLDFCHKIKHLPLKKVLLTGVGDKELAVDAFNAGLINSFIIKNPSTILSDITTALNYNQNNFFSSLSNYLLDFVWPDSEKNALINLLHEIINKFSIKEYYIADKYGSFLLRSNLGDNYFLMIIPEASFSEMLLVGKDNEASSQVIEALETKTAYPLFTSEIDKKELVNTWDDKLTLVNKISNSKFYYGIAKCRESYVGK